MNETNEHSPYSREMVECLTKEHFNQEEVNKWWFEKPIPPELIPAEFQITIPLPGGRSQVIDKRVNGYNCALYDFGDHKADMMVVCPNVVSDHDNP